MQTDIVIKPYDQSFVNKFVSATHRVKPVWIKVEYVGKQLLMGLDMFGTEIVDFLSYKYNVKDSITATEYS